MDSASINPAKGPDIQTTKPPVAPEKPAASSPKAPVQAAPKDTVSLSPAAKEAASSENSAQQADSPKSESVDLGVNKSRQFSVTEAKDVVLKIVDNETQEVIKQIPSEEVLDLRNAIRDGVERIAPKDNPTEKLI
jgi:flagellar protein FlaG